MLRTKWITYSGICLVVGLTIYEMLLIDLSIGQMKSIDRDLFQVLARQGAAIGIFLAALGVRVWLVRKGDETNYQRVVGSWWMVAISIGAYHALNVNYLDLYCFFTGEFCNPIFTLTGRADFVQSAGILFFWVGGVRAFFTALAAAVLTKRTMQ
jgi:hypothetical protein